MCAYASNKDLRPSPRGPSPSPRELRSGLMEKPFESSIDASGMPTKSLSSNAPKTLRFSEMSKGPPTSHAKSRSERSGLNQQIQQGIEDIMYHRHDESKKFTTRQKLEKIWSVHSIQDVPGLERLNALEAQTTRERFLVILSILIYMGWSELQRFRAVFIRTGLDDNHLLFDEQELVLGLGRAAKKFVKYQYYFKPVILRPTLGDLEILPSAQRLPIVENLNYELPAGATVSKIVVAPGCVQTESSGSLRANVEVC